MNWVGSCVHKALRTKVELERSCRLLEKLSASLHSKGQFCTSNLLYDLQKHKQMSFASEWNILLYISVVHNSE